MKCCFFYYKKTVFHSRVFLHFRATNGRYGFSKKKKKKEKKLPVCLILDLANMLLGIQTAKPLVTFCFQQIFSSVGLKTKKRLECVASTIYFSSLFVTTKNVASKDGGKFENLKGASRNM